jgi:hypothetical protein
MNSQSRKTGQERQQSWPEPSSAGRRRNAGIAAGLQLAGYGVKHLTAPAGENGYARWCGSPNDRIGGCVPAIEVGRILVVIDVAVSA